MSESSVRRAEAAGAPHVHPHTPDGGHVHLHPHDEAGTGARDGGRGHPGSLGRGPLDSDVPAAPAETRPTSPSRGVVVDVGDGVGALVLYADSSREWLEPEIHPIDDPAARQHVWILERAVGSGSVYAAVFPSLPEGRYGVCSPEGQTAQEVEVLGGAVTEARWL